MGDDEDRKHGPRHGSTRFATRNSSTEGVQQHAEMNNNAPAQSPGRRLEQQRKSLRRAITFRSGMGTKVPSMLFDIEIEGENDMEGTDGSGESVLDLHTAESIYMCLLPSSEEEGKLREDVEQAAKECVFSDSQADDTHQLALRLRQFYPDVRVRTALGGGEGRSCLRNLRHTFLTVHLAGRSFIIDLAFKEQFIIAKPTKRYAVLLDCLPRVHVAEEDAVEPLVRFLCKEMALAFQQQATQIPPWRYADSMMSKWRPRRSLDTPALSSGPNSTEHAQALDASHLLVQEQILQQQLLHGECLANGAHAAAGSGSLAQTQGCSNQREQGPDASHLLAQQHLLQRQPLAGYGDDPAAGMGLKWRDSNGGTQMDNPAQPQGLDQQEGLLCARALDHQSQARAHSELPVGLVEGMQGVHAHTSAVYDGSHRGQIKCDLQCEKVCTSPSPPDLVEGMGRLQVRPACGDGDRNGSDRRNMPCWKLDGDSAVGGEKWSSGWEAGGNARAQQQQQHAQPPANAPGSTNRSNPVNCEPQVVIVGGDFSSL